VDGDPGYRIAGRVLLDVSFAAERYPDTASRVRAAGEMARRLRQVPGVGEVAAATVTPDYPGSWAALFRVPGLEPPDPPGFFETNHDLVTPDYFTALGIPLLAGRTFTPEEMQDPLTRSVIVSRGFARRFFGSADPLGREIRQVDGRGNEVSRRTVVGVVGDVERASYGESWPVRHGWYLPLSAGSGYDLADLTLVVQVNRKGAGLFEELRRAVLAADPAMAASRVAWMRERLVEAHSRNQLSTVLYSLFGAIALLVAALGLFSLQSFLVSARLREFGVRLALGASPRGLLLRVLGDSLRLDLLALVAGLPLLLGAFRLYRAFVSGTGGVDPALVCGAGLVLLASSLLATWLPATRAARSRPARILQDDAD
jgi:putative ABC transport system permease protein